MCRSIKSLRVADHQATDLEISEAALQYVRKVSGFRMPSRLNQAAFEVAVQEVASATHKMLVSLATASSSAAGVSRTRGAAARTTAG